MSHPHDERLLEFLFGELAEAVPARVVAIFGAQHPVLARHLVLAGDAHGREQLLGDADLALNWRATVFFPDNSQQLEAVDLDPKHARPQALLLNLLTFSPNPALARKFMDYVASADGQAVFRKYGFLDNSINR